MEDFFKCLYFDDLGVISCYFLSKFYVSINLFSYYFNCIIWPIWLVQIRYEALITMEVLISQIFKISRLSNGLYWILFIFYVIMAIHQAIIDG